MDATMKLQAIRLIATQARPYFARSLHALRLVNAPFVPTMQTDRHGRVYVNTTRIGGKGGWTLQEAAAVLVHELNHWLRKHHARADSFIRDAAPEELRLVARKVNCAQDLEINDDLGDRTFKLPEDGLFPKKYNLPEHLLWEQYYPLLPESLVADVDCGSVADGVPRPYELPIEGDVTVLTEAEQDLLRRHTAKEIADYDKRAPGRLPSGLRLWAAQYLAPPQVQWERELTALVRNAFTMASGQHDYRYGRRSRRQLPHARVILPAMVRPEISAAVVLDTSGSMDEGLRNAALSETQGVLRAAGQRRVPVLCCDAAVHGGVQRVSNALDIEVYGGGGTDMGVGIEAAQKLGVAVILVLTDGATPWPELPPRGAELVVGIVGRAPEADLRRWVPDYVKRVVFIRPQKEAER